MKFICERRAFLDAATMARRGVEGRSIIPMLGNALIVASKGAVSFSGTNVDRIITATCAAEVAKAGAITASAEQVTLFAKNAPDGSQVECELTDDDRLVFRAGRARLSLPTLPKRDFPDFSAGKFQHSFTVDGAELAKALAFVVHAQSTETTRIYLNGIYLHEEDGNLAVVACDGTSLGKTTLNGQTFPAFTPLIVPRAYIADLQAIADRSSILTLEISETRARASGDGLSLTTKLIDGTFPDYRRLVSPSAPRRFSVDVVSFNAAVVRCSMLADGIDRTVKLSLRSGILALSSSRRDQGDVSDEIEVEGGQDFDVGFHARRLQNALACLKGSTEVEALFENGGPILLRDPAKPHAIQIIAAQRV